MKILALTAIRSDYDLMSGLYQELHADEYFDIGLLVFGAHLSKTLGESLTQIYKDEIPIVAKIETLIDSDSRSARLKSASIALMNSIDSVRDHQPDLIVYAGDREDVIIGALLGGYLQIPTAHFFAGDHSPDGHIDNPVRHAASKLSTFCFASTEEHVRRLLAIGEEPKRVLNVGSIALDRLISEERSTFSSVSEKYGLKVLSKQFALVIFHPITEEIEVASNILTDILESLLELNISPVVGAPNTDPGHGFFDVVRNKFEGDCRVFFYNVLPRDEFLCFFENAALIIGNSSAGIIEAASLKVPCVNVGQRQKGRLSGKNVVFVTADGKSIRDGINCVLSDDFQGQMSQFRNPYGNGDSIPKVIAALKDIDFPSLLKKKTDPASQFKELS